MKGFEETVGGVEVFFVANPDCVLVSFGYDTIVSKERDEGIGSRGVWRRC